MRAWAWLLRFAGHTREAQRDRFIGGGSDVPGKLIAQLPTAPQLCLCRMLCRVVRAPYRLACPALLCGHAGAADLAELTNSPPLSPSPGDPTVQGVPVSEQPRVQMHRDRLTCIRHDYLVPMCACKWSASQGRQTDQRRSIKLFVPIPGPTQREPASRGQDHQRASDARTTQHGAAQGTAAMPRGF